MTKKTYDKLIEEANKPSRNARYEQRRRERGLTRVTVWVPGEDADKIHALAAELVRKKEAGA